MKNLGQLSCSLGVLGLVVATSAVAMAQDDDNPATPAETRLGEGTPRNTVAPNTNAVEEPPPPPAPSVVLPGMGVSQQAGIGGEIAYGRTGVLELGGSGGFAAANNYTRLNFSPSVGLFLVDNVELSMLAGINYFRVGATDTAPKTSATELTALIEPSFHLPFSEVAFGFIGLGAGVNYITGQDAGFLVQPRLGGNFLIGRSGILTPALTVGYSTVDAIRTEAGTVLAVRTSYGLNVGYTVMW
jgi:hypothetical protein